MADPGTQTVNFEGSSYTFPADAKDEEILGFLHHNALPPAKSPISVHYPGPRGGDSPIAPPAPPQMREMGVGEALTGVTPEQDNARALRAPQHAFDLAKGTLKSIGQVSTPAIVGSLLKKSHPDMLPKPVNDFTLSAEGGAHSPLVSSVAQQGLMSLSGGLESAPEASAGVEGGVGVESGRPTGRTAAAPSPSPESTAPSGTRATSVAESTPLVKKVPGTRSNFRDAVGLIHGVARPTSVGGIMDAMTSIKSILAKHEAEPAVEETGGEAPMPHQGAGKGGWGSPVSQWGQRIPEPSKTVRRPVWADNESVAKHGAEPLPSVLGGGESPEPNTARNLLKRTRGPEPPAPASTPRPRTPVWAGKDTSGTPVESIAPQVQGQPNAADVQSMLEKTGPPKGGKAQTARALMRKNVKEIKK